MLEKVDMVVIENKFEIGEAVYHITPDSYRGVVLDCRYSLRFDEWEYLVSFGPDKESLLYFDTELSKNKIF